jgi:uncharacterized protein (DUF486 family)
MYNATNKKAPNPEIDPSTCDTRSLLSVFQVHVLQNTISISILYGFNVFSLLELLTLKFCIDLQLLDYWIACPTLRLCS